MKRTEGFTLIEILFVVAIIGLLAGLSFPGLQRARLAANESSVMGSLRTINSGQQTFWSTCGNGFYSPSLQNLGTPVGGAPGFVSPDLSTLPPVVKSGFEYDMGTDSPVGTTSCNGSGAALAYHVTADPMIGNGRRYFGTNTLGTIYESTETLFGQIRDDRAPDAPAAPIQ